MEYSQLVLGTAQLGADYGIAYKAKKIPLTDFKSIMDLGRDYGVNSIDTAMVYGDSQKILGEIGIKEWSVTTKLSPVPDNIASIDNWFFDSIEESLQELRIKKIDTLLVHNVKELSGSYGGSLVRLLRSSKLKEYVNKVGVSIYTPQDLDAFYDNFRPDVVQCPYNIFDQRISTSGWLQKLTSDNVEIHARSVFLQGVILKNVNELNTYFNPWLSYFEKWENYCKNNNISKLQAALGFVKDETAISKIIVGIENRNQFEQILNAFKPNTKEIFKGSCEKTALLNPLMWKID